MHRRLRPKRAFAHTGVPLPGTTWVAVATTLVLGLCAAGCGSSSKSSTTAASTTTAAITKVAFLAKANALCTQSNIRTNAAGAKLGKNPTREQVIAVVKSKFVPSIQTTIDGIRALGAPPGDQATVTKILDLAQADLNKVKSTPLLLVGRISPFHDFAKIAHPYGLTACAQNA